MTKKLSNAAGDRADINDALGAISWDKRMADARARRAKILAAKTPQQPVANDWAAPDDVAGTPVGDPALTDLPPEWMTAGVEQVDKAPEPAVAVAAAHAAPEEDPFAAPRRARRVAIMGYVAGAFAFGILAGLGMLTIARMQDPGTAVASLAPQPVTQAPSLPNTAIGTQVATAPQTDPTESAIAAGAPTLETPAAPVTTAALGDAATAALPPSQAPLDNSAPQTDAQVPALTAALAATVPQLAPSASDGVPARLLASRSLPTDALLPQALITPAIPVSLPQLVITEPPVSTVWVPRGLALAEERDISVILTATSAMSNSRFDGFVEAAEATGLPLTATQRVGFAITRDQVRFFHTEDTAAAGILADALNTELRDFTAFSPKPPVGTLEVYLSGRSDAPPVIDSATAEIDRLRERLINNLQRGDHL